jgi:hypothetical protein
VKLICQAADLLLQGQLALVEVLKAFKADLFTSSIAESSKSRRTSGLGGPLGITLTSSYINAHVVSICQSCTPIDDS